MTSDNQLIQGTMFKLSQLTSDGDTKSKQMDRCRKEQINLKQKR